MSRYLRMHSVVGGQVDLLREGLLTGRHHVDPVGKCRQSSPDLLVFPLEC
jgi:hypothetical protein